MSMTVTLFDHTVHVGFNLDTLLLGCLIFIAWCALDWAVSKVIDTYGWNGRLRYARGSRHLDSRMRAVTVLDIHHEARKYGAACPWVLVGYEDEVTPSAWVPVTDLASGDAVTIR